MISIGTMIKKLGGMCGTADLKAKDDKFIRNMVDRTSDGRETRHLSEFQVKWIEDLHDRFFA